MKWRSSDLLSFAVARETYFLPRVLINYNSNLIISFMLITRFGGTNLSFEKVICHKFSISTIRPRRQSCPIFAGSQSHWSISINPRRWLATTDSWTKLPRQLTSRSISRYGLYDFQCKFICSLFHKTWFFFYSKLFLRGLSAYDKKWI